jgi:hypothetical protein
MAAGAVDVNLAVEHVTAAALQAAADLLATHGLAGGWVTTGDAEPVAAPPGVHVVPVLVPPTGAPDALARAERIAAKAALRVVRVCPGTHGYPLLDWVLTPLPELCARERMAMMLDFSPGEPPWRELVELARQHPALPLVVVGGSMSMYTVPAVLDATANVILDASGLPDLAAEFGVHRFVWGSAGSPDRMRRERPVAVALASTTAALAAGTYAETYL